MTVSAWLRAVVLFLSVVTVAQGGVYYVAQSGDDGNPGNSTNSPKTIVLGSTKK